MTHLLEYLTSNRWAMDRATLDRFRGVIERHLNGERRDASEIEAVVEKRDREIKIEDARVDGGVAVIPISGVIAPHARLVNGASQPRGTSVGAIRKQMRAAIGDPSVHTLLFDIESPGGSVQGIDDLAEEIRAARDAKRIVAHTDSLMASAAYWLASQAHEVYATRSADVGSIGVYAVVDDYSKRYESTGVKTHVVSSGGHKGAGVPGTEITAEHLAEFQASVDATNDLFVAAVAEGRGVDEKGVRKSWNTGQTWMGSRASSLGLIDGVETFEGLLGRLQREQGEQSSTERAARAANMESETEEGDAMDEKKKSEPTVEAPAVDLEKVRAEGVEAERARVKAIREAAHETQRELADELVENGVSAEDARSALHADLVSRFDAAQAEAEAAAAVKAEEPKEPKASRKSVDLYGKANEAATFGSTEEADGTRRRASSVRLEDRADLFELGSSEFTRLVAEEWEAREDELTAEYTDFNGFHGAMIGARWEQQALKGVSHG